MNFKESTNKETLTKSLKLELKPATETIAAIKNDKLNELDEELRNQMNEYKPYIDKVIVAILNQSMENAKIDFLSLIELKEMLETSDSTDFENKKEILNKIRDEKENIKKEVVKAIEENLPKPLRSIKDISSAKFLKDVMPDVLAVLNMTAEEKNTALILADILSSYTISMNKFLLTRVTALSAWAPSRVLENFEIYVNNVEIIKAFVESDDSADFIKDYPEVFSIISKDYYRYLLSQEAIDGYNKIISGECNESGIVKKGYNQYVNEINQAHASTKEYKGAYYKKAKQLFKQILVPEKKQFSIEKIKNDDEQRKLIVEFQNIVTNKDMVDVYNLLRDEKKENVFISGRNLHTFSHISCGEHLTIPAKLIDLKEKSLEEQKKNLTKKSDIKKIDKLIDKVSELVKEEKYSVAELEMIMNDNQLFERFLNKAFEKYSFTIKNAQKLEDNYVLDRRKIFRSPESKEFIKDYFDSIIDYRKCISVFKCKDIPVEAADFYNKYEEKLETLKPITKAVNLTRNYLTAKPKDLAEENPVCFGMSGKSNLSWWKVLDKKLASNKAVIVRRDNKYYFAETNPFAKPIVINRVDSSNVEFLSYTTSQNPMLLFPMRAFTTNVKEAFKSKDVMEVPYEYADGLMVTREIFEIKEKNLFTTGAVKKGIVSKEEMKSALEKMIDFYKEACKVDPVYKRFNFVFKDTKDYEDIGLFFDDAKLCTTKAEWVPIDEKSFDDAVESGDLLCFLITNLHMYKDDLSKTSYAETFLHIMSDENLKELNFRLNSAPGVTFRKASMPFKITHKKGSILLDKRNIYGEPIDDVYEELYNFVNGRLKESELSDAALAQKDLIKTKVCKYDIQKYKRYQEDKYFISLSYVINNKLSPRQKNNINEEVTMMFDKGCKVLTVVRGTTDLLYYCLYDENKNLIKKESLNMLYNTDYSKKLRLLSDKRNREKSENWNYDLQVNSVKESFLKFAIAKITEIAIENNAIIVIEKFNENYKNKMQAIDNQVFKSFENKLKNRLLDYRKNTTSGESAVISNPLQLTKNLPSAETPFQNGILFSENSSYTSNMCPKTGFVNLFDLADIRTNGKKREFLSKFDEIRLLGDRVYFSFDYCNFQLKNKIDAKKLNKTKWQVIAGKPKTVYNKEKGCYEYIKNPVLKAYNILEKEQIFNIEKASDKQIKALYQLFEDAVSKNIVKKCKEVEKEYFSSPVTEDDDMLSVAEVTAINLTNKFWYYISLEKGDFVVEQWFNTVQENIINNYNNTKVA